MSEWTNDPLEELARELRQGVGAELRAEAEITERETHAGYLRGLKLSDIGRAAMHRGDLVSLITATKTVTGLPVFVGKDYLVIETKTEIVDAPFERILIRVERQPQGGHTTRGGSITFKARLSELEHSGEMVTICSADTAFEMVGRVAIVSTDHCIIEDPTGPRFHVPITQISMILRPRPD